MGRQRAENLQGIEIKKDISEDRGRQRAENLHIGISRKKERGREKKRKSRDLSNRSLKTDGETESKEPT